MDINIPYLILIVIMFISVLGIVWYMGEVYRSGLYCAYGQNKCDEKGEENG